MYEFLRQTSEDVYFDGPLSRHGYELVISAETLYPDKQIELETGKDYTIRIKSMRDRFRGALIRLEAPPDVDSTDALLPQDDWMQVEESCEAPVVGISTSDDQLKPGVIGTLRLNDEGTVTLGVTVVKIMSEEVSTYTYSQYRVKFTSDPLPTPSPTPFYGFCSVYKYQDCLSDHLTEDDADDCDKCINSAIKEPFATCSDMNDVLCAAVAHCPCGRCDRYAESYLDCAFETLVGCGIDCEAIKPMSKRGITSSSSSSQSTRARDEFTFSS
jgi:hypothetical protein